MRKFEFFFFFYHTVVKEWATVCCHNGSVERLLMLAWLWMMNAPPLSENTVSAPVNKSLNPELLQWSLSVFTSSMLWLYWAAEVRICVTYWVRNRSKTVKEGTLFWKECGMLPLWLSDSQKCEKMCLLLLLLNPATQPMCPQHWLS